MLWFAIICIIIFFLFVRPAYKVWKTVNQARHQAREMSDAFRRAAGIDPDEERRRQAEQKRASRKGGWTTPAPRRKKIDSATGEYVKFKEITVVESENGGSAGDNMRSSAAAETEEQVVDVSWEELK